MAKTYAERKAEIRQEALDYQMTWQTENYSYGEIAEYESYFAKQGKRYGLLEEFKENGIC